MNSNIVKDVNIKHRNILFGVTLSLLTFFNIAHAKGDLKLSSDAHEVLKFVNKPQAKNDKLNDPQTQNDTELVMSILKYIEDKNITESNKKIEFINSSKVSNYIKNGVINEIQQNITYSDYEKVSYGIYMLKKCNNNSKANVCYIDQRPVPYCVYERSNICCVNN